MYYITRLSARDTKLYFSQGNHEVVVQRLLRHGSTVDCRTADLLTPLHIAAHCGHRKTAELLLKEGADVDACALNGFTPLHVACKKNRFEMVRFLIEKDANTTISTESGLTALMVAAYVDKVGTYANVRCEKCPILWSHNLQFIVQAIVRF